MPTPSSRAIVEHVRHTPVLVIGHARSGTSLLCRLLLDHLGVNFGTESQFIVRVHRRLARYGDLREDSNLRRLFEHIAQERFFERTRHNFGFEFDIDLAMRSITERTYGGVLRTIFDQFATTRGYSRWGDKTPEYVSHLPLLAELFPNAQYIHIVRDGRAVAASMRATAFGSKTALETAVSWTTHIDLAQRFRDSLPPGRFLEIRYEELVDEPASVLERVARYLGVVDPEAVVQAARERLRTQVRRERFQAWKTGALARREIVCFEASARYWLLLQGYELHIPANEARVGPLERVYWRGVGLSRRLRDVRIWRDNWYKLLLRARATALYLQAPARLWSRRPSAITRARSNRWGAA